MKLENMIKLEDRLKVLELKVERMRKEIKRQRDLINEFDPKTGLKQMQKR